MPQIGFREWLRPGRRETVTVAAAPASLQPPATTPSRWGSATHWALVLLITSTLWFARWTSSSPGAGWNDVTLWLDAQSLSSYKLLFKKAGVTTLEEVAELDLNKNGFGLLDYSSKGKLQRATAALKDRLTLQSWLTDQSLEQYVNRFHDARIVSLQTLAAAPDDLLQQLADNEKDYKVLRSKVQNIRDQLDLGDLDKVKESQWLRARKQLLVERGTKFGTAELLLTGAVAAVVLALTMLCTHSQPGSLIPLPSTKHSLFEYVTGKYLATQFTRVEWDWDEPQVVGKTVTFKIKFYQRNGRPYPVSTGDNLLVEIMHGNTQIPPTLQYGLDVNTVAVAFAVHRSGDYKISILIGAKHIRSSPFRKEFLPGSLDPMKTQFVGQSQIVVCTENMNHRLMLEPRDEYANLCNYDPSTDKRENYNLTLTEIVSGKSLNPRLQITFDKTTGRIVLHLTMAQEGCYQALATYRNTPISNGHFTLLVLTDKESAVVQKAVAKKCHNLFYEARLLSANYDPQSKARKVFVYISPKQLTIKEFYLKVIPKRLFTFRVCPSTKIQFQGYNNQYEAPTLVIEDGSQPPVELAARDRNIIAATFTNFLLKNIGGSETFKDKQDFFCHKVRQQHQKRLHERFTVKVTRANLLESSYKACKHFSTSDWCKNFEVVFHGEEALDWGGVRREWFELLGVSLFDPRGSGLFQRLNDDSQGLVHPSPNRPPHLKSKYYEFAGKVVGKCLYESALGGSYRQLVKARFSRSFLAQIIGLRVNYKYFEQDDPELYKTKIKFILENDVEDMELTFSEEEYKNGKLDRVVELIGNGSKVAVTNSNKLRYLDALAQYKLASCVKEEIEAFLKGLNDLIPDTLLSIFDENELELLMCGTGNYSITDFKDHHILSGSSPEFQKVLDWFWTIVSGFTQEEMARLLQFTTGCSQLPPGGFAELNPKFQITAAPTYGVLPTAHTCFNQLCLPDYDSMEQFERLLKIALVEGSQGFGMI